jgi:hypothetical protein
MDNNRRSVMRSRWAALGAAVAVTLGAGGIGFVSATSPDGAVAYVPITPCRLADTRAAVEFNVGPRSTPIGAEQTYTIAAHGDNGECVGIPTAATGLELNVTALSASEATYLTIWPSGGLPNSSALNPTPGEPPTPNSVTTGVTGTGQFNVFNRYGTVQVVIDVVGYYADHQHTGADIVDNTVTNLDTSNEPGVAFDYRSTTIAATTDPESIVGTSIRVPSDGFVTIEVTGLWNNTTVGIDRVFCQLQKGTIGVVDTTQPWFRLDDRSTASSYTAFSAHRVMPIAVADNPLFFQFGQGINLVCDLQTGGVSFDDIQISATFHATSYRPSGFIIALDEGVGPEADS